MKLKHWILIGVGVVALITLICCTHIVQTGYTGIRVSFGQISDEPVLSGRLLITMPFVEHIYKVNNKQQDMVVRDRIWGETNDKTPVYADGVAVTYQISADRSVWIYQNVTNYTKNLITDSLVASAVKSAMAELSPQDVTVRDKIEPSVQDKLNVSLAGKYGAGTVFISKVTIDNMDFEEAYNSAIQAKSLATQERARVEIENETAVAKAEAEKRVSVLNAEAKAETVRIAAEAEANANHLIEESLTQRLIEAKIVDAWNGKLPTVLGSTSILSALEIFGNTEE